MAEVTELTVDDGYKNIRIRIDGNIVATQEIIESVTITVGCTDGSAPAFGASFSPHCDVTINSNEIIGDSALDAIVMGAIFIVECELTTGVYEAMGRFEIGQPVQYIDDYQISFSGEGMLGSVLARKRMNWDLMRGLGDNAKKGILTLNQAIGLVHSQFPNVTIVLPSSSFMPQNYENMKIVVPLSLNKWKKNVAFKKRFVKLTVRDFVAGIAVMLAGNVVEYGDSIRIVSIREAWNNESIVDDKFFTADSYMADYTAERIPYAPKSLRLKTYVTLPVTTSKKGSSSKTTHGYCYEDDCECGSVYGYSESTSGVNLYDAYVDCQWIGRSFEAFFFNGGVVSTVNSGEYDDDYETLHSNFKYTPLTVEFSGWNDIFEPAHFIKIRTVKKNTATQQETTVDVLAYIADMTFTWDGTVSVLISSSFNGEAGEVTVTIGTNQASSAWNNGTNIPEFANEVEPEPIEGEWIRNRIDGYNSGGSASGVVFDGKVHILSSLKYWVYDTDHIASVLDNDREFLGRLVVFNNSIHRVGAYREDNPRITYVEKLENNAWIQIHSFSEEYSSGILVSNSACLYRNSIVFLGNYNDGRDHSCIITWNGTTTTIKEIPFSFSGATHHSFEYNGVAYWFGDFGSSTKNYSYVAYDGTSIELHDINNPSESIYTLKRYACVYNDNIHGINLFGSSSPLKLLELFHDEWVEITDSPFSSGSGGYDFACEYNGKLTLFVPYYVYTFNPS